MIYDVKYSFASIDCLCQLVGKEPCLSTKENLGDFIHTSSGHSSCQALYPIAVNGLLELLIGRFLFQDVSGIS